MSAPKLGILSDSCDQFPCAKRQDTELGPVAHQASPNRLDT